MLSASITTSASELADINSAPTALRRDRRSPRALRRLDSLRLTRLPRRASSPRATRVGGVSGSGASPASDSVSADGASTASGCSDSDSGGATTVVSSSSGGSASKVAVYVLAVIALIQIRLIRLGVSEFGRRL